MPYRYVDHTMNPTQVNRQVSYGPTADIAPLDQQRLQNHYGTPQVLARVTQYSTRHATYVAAAQAGNRPLTIQEDQARVTGRQATHASINHVIASGTGQNLLNEGTLSFQTGQARVNQHWNAAIGPMAPGRLQARMNVMHGIAEQAAAVGRQQGYSRAIINERGNEPLNNTATNRRIYGNAQAGQRLQVQPTRDMALQHTLTAFQGATPNARVRAYRDVLRMTFDSPGNLRVGDEYGNNLARTGIDIPLRADGLTPTAHGQRLLNAHATYAPPRLHAPNRTFTIDQNNVRVSSSMEEPNPGVRNGKRPATYQLSAPPTTKKPKLNPPSAPSGGIPTMKTGGFTFAPSPFSAFGQSTSPVTARPIFRVKGPRKITSI
ncbi:hypothetical protein [Burkholderia sp. 3C]